MTDEQIGESAAKIAVETPFSYHDIYELMRYYVIIEDEMTEVCNKAARIGTTPGVLLCANGQPRRKDEPRPKVKYKHVKEWKPGPWAEPPESTKAKTIGWQKTRSGALRIDGLHPVTQDTKHTAYMLIRRLRNGNFSLIVAHTKLSPSNFKGGNVELTLDQVEQLTTWISKNT